MVYNECSATKGLRLEKKEPIPTSLFKCSWNVMEQFGRTLAMLPLPLLTRRHHPTNFQCLAKSPCMGAWQWVMTSSVFAERIAREREREREREIGRESRKFKVSKMSCGTFDLNQPLYIHIMTPLVFFLFRKREPRPSVDLVSRPRWTPLVRCPAGGRTPVVGALRAKRWRRLVSPVVGSWTSTAPWLRPTPSLTPWCTLGSIL